MLTAQLESAKECLDEIQWLFPLHWKELALNQEKIPLDPRYDEYLRREETGELVFASIRSDGEIVGYFVGFTGISLHYKSMMACTPDIFYVHPDRRGLAAGTMLFDFVKTELKRRGVKYWIVGDKNHKTAGAFFEKLGFNKIENYYAMMLEE